MHWLPAATNLALISLAQTCCKASISEPIAKAEEIKIANADHNQAVNFK